MTLGSHRTTAEIQLYLDHSSGDGRVESIIRPLLNRAIYRLRQWSVSVLNRNNHCLTCPPRNLDAEEMLRDVLERRLTALCKGKSATVRNFIDIARHDTRRVLKDLGRTLDEPPRSVERSP